MIVRVWRNNQMREIDAPTPLQPYLGLAVFVTTAGHGSRARGFWRVDWYRQRPSSFDWRPEYEYLETTNESDDARP